MSVLSRIRVPDSIQRRAELDVATGHATQVLTTSVVLGGKLSAFCANPFSLCVHPLHPKGPSDWQLPAVYH